MWQHLLDVLEWGVAFARAQPFVRVGQGAGRFGASLKMGK